MMMMMMMMMMIRMLNYFCGMIDQQNTFSVISSYDDCQISSLWQIYVTPRAGFERLLGLSSGVIE